MDLHLNHSSKFRIRIGIIQILTGYNTVRAVRGKGCNYFLVIFKGPLIARINSVALLWRQVEVHALAQVL